MTFDEAVSHALTRPGAERATSYGKPAVKVNSRTVLSLGHEPASSFVLHLDLGLVDLLMTMHPETFWQTPHYAGYAAVLVRQDGPDDDLVREWIDRACADALSRRPAQSRR